MDADKQKLIDSLREKLGNASQDVKDLESLLNQTPTPGEPGQPNEPDQTITDLQAFVNTHNYIVIDKLWELATPLRLHNNLIIEFRIGTLKAVEIMDNVLDGREVSNVTVRGDGVIQANGKAKIGIDFRFKDQIVTHNKVSDVKVFGATDVGIDFSNNSEFMLSGQWEVNGAADWSGPDPVRYSDYGLRVTNSGGQNTLIGGSIQGNKKGDIYISGGTLKVFSTTFLTSKFPGHTYAKDVIANIVIESKNPGVCLYIFGSWMEQMNRPNIHVNTIAYDVGVLELNGVQMFTSEMPNIVGIKARVDLKGIGYFNVFGGYHVSAVPDPDYQVDAYIWTMGVYLGGSGNAKKGYANLNKVTSVRHMS